MGKKKLPAIPKPRRLKAAKSEAVEQEQPPDLSYIIEPLRHLAVPVGDLNFDPENARRHDEANIAAVVGSLTEFGQDQPLVVQKQGMIVRKGNCRLTAALRLGWSHVAVVPVDESRARAIARALTDNRTAELAEWDKELLKELVGVADWGNDPKLDEMMEDLKKETLKGPEGQGLQGTSQGGNGRTKSAATIVCPNCNHRFTRRA